MLSEFESIKTKQQQTTIEHERSAKEEKDDALVSKLASSSSFGDSHHRIYRRAMQTTAASTAAATSSTCVDFSLTSSPNYEFESDFDLIALQTAIKSAEYLDESGYQSIVQRSTHSPYGMGWMMLSAATDQQGESQTADDDDDNWGWCFFYLIKCRIIILHRNTQPVFISIILFISTTIGRITPV
jgi:hypothetical protein